MSTISEGFAILGFPRSGTTLLRRLLDAHSEIDCPGETYLLSSAAKFLASHSVAGGVSVGVESGLSFLGILPDETVERLREFVFSFRREHLDRSGQRIWGEKTATDVFYLETIERIFGDHLHFICVHRHGLDVILSVKEWCDKCDAYPPEIHKFVARYPRPLEALAHAWVDRTERLLEFSARHADRAIDLHYEDLVRDPDEQLGRLLSFLELCPEEELLEAAFQKAPDGFGDWKAYGAQSLQDDAIDRWRKLPSTTIDELGAIVNPMLDRLGYSTLPVSVRLDPAEALRRYHFGLRLQRKA